MWKRLFGSGRATEQAPEEPRAVSATDIQACQADLVRAVAASVTDLFEGEWEDREWLRLFVNYEALWERGVKSALSFSVARKPGQALETVSFRLSAESRAAFKRLAEMMKAQGGTYWTVCNLEIDRDGTFRFDFSYDRPYRIDGTLNDKRFEDYLDRFTAQTGIS